MRVEGIQAGTKGSGMEAGRREGREKTAYEEGRGKAQCAFALQPLSDS